MIEIIDLHKSFGNHHVLKGVNLKIEKGESMVVIGGSGSGKSVLLKHIIGILRPDKGNILIDGIDITKLNERELYEIRKKIWYAFSNGSII